MKILLLEDDLELCTSIRAELEKSGYVVDCCMLYRWGDRDALCSECRIWI